MFDAEVDPRFYEPFRLPERDPTDRPAARWLVTLVWTCTVCGLVGTGFGLLP